MLSELVFRRGGRRTAADVPGSGPLHCDLRDDTVDAAEIVRRELHSRRADVFFQAMQFCGAGASDESVIHDRRMESRKHGFKRPG